MDEIDWLYPFGCLPPSNENEWLNLKPFVDIYNSIHSTHYILQSFPENDNRTTPEPEILLRDGDRYQAVILITGSSGVSWQIRTAWIVLFDLDIALTFHGMWKRLF